MQHARLPLYVLVLGLFAPLAGWRPAPQLASDAEVAGRVSRALLAVAERVDPTVVSIVAFGPGGTARGSGLLLSKDGLIVTNHHVVADAREVHVTFQDGRRESAEVLGEDAETDLAVLDAPGEDHPYATLAAGEPPAVGTLVLALGNPLGLDHTVTFGIVSARGRHDVGITFYEDFIQTDAAINAGNSGGPLVDLAGEVVGINTAKEMVPGGQGLGFAIPAYMVREVVEEIIDKGYVERGWFGISVAQMSERRAAARGLARMPHVFVREVLEDSPAAAAGFRADDVVLRIGEREVKTSRDVLDAIARLDPGTLTEVLVWRDGRHRMLRVTVGERELR